MSHQESSNKKKTQRRQKQQNKLNEKWLLKIILLSWYIYVYHIIRFQFQLKLVVETVCHSIMSFYEILHRSIFRDCYSKISDFLFCFVLLTALARNRHSVFVSSLEICIICLLICTFFNILHFRRSNKATITCVTLNSFHVSHHTLPIHMKGKGYRAHTRC